MLGLRFEGGVLKCWDLAVWVKRLSFGGMYSHARRAAAVDMPWVTRRRERGTCRRLSEVAPGHKYCTVCIPMAFLFGDVATWFACPAHTSVFPRSRVQPRRESSRFRYSSGSLTLVLLLMFAPPPTRLRQAQKANRYFRGLVESSLEPGREFPVVRVQEDTELFR